MIDRSLKLAGFAAVHAACFRHINLMTRLCVMLGLQVVECKRPDLQNLEIQSNENCASIYSIDLLSTISSGCKSAASCQQHVFNVRLIAKIAKQRH